jgi:hypothetical protein
MAKHTPGPWAVNHRDSEMPYIVADQGKAWDNPIICNLYEDVTPEDSVTIGLWLEAHLNAQANARLIHAAPDMLAALESAYTSLFAAIGPAHPITCQVAAAIAKATD